MMLLVILGVFCNNVLGQDLSLTTDIKTLSELPLEKLLQIKKTFKVDDDSVTELKANSTILNPQALPLQSKKSSKDRRGSYHNYQYSDDYPEKGSKTDVQSIFQISVTTLAFLAFGGYLICLLVQAVKGKSSYDMSSATQVMSALVNSQIRRRTTRAPLRLQHQRPSNYRRRRRPRPRPKREISGDAMETMYYSLISLSEGYTKYHTEDYLSYFEYGRWTSKIDSGFVIHQEHQRT